jgi:hypothetical protein
MARDSDNLARSFETEDAGGLLTGFLAEEDQFDRRSLWRLGWWGVGAVGAVIVAVLAHQSSIGLRREQIANADLARQSQQIQSIARESQHETRRLASAIDTLNGDRDRLYSRITVLEQGLDSMTGSIARQNAAAGSPQATPQSSSIVSSSIVSSAPVSSSPVSSSTLPASPVASSTTTSASLPSQATSASAASSATASQAPASPAKAEPPVAQSAAPTVAPVATTAAAKDAAMPDKPPPVAAASEPASLTAAPPARPMASNALAATPATPLMPAKSIMAPPDVAAGKLIAPDTPPDTAAAAPDPEVVAATTSSDDANADAAPAAATVQQTEFAVDVGTANSVGGLRALWRGLLKSKSNAALAALHPIIVVKEANNGLGMQLRLVAGPLSDAAAAAKICAAMLEGKRATCETTVFDGQHLALKDDEPQASARLAPGRPAVHRRSIAKRVMTVEPPKPQPTTLSLFFSR